MIDAAIKVSLTLLLGENNVLRGLKMSLLQHVVRRLVFKRKGGK